MPKKKQYTGIDAGKIICALIILLYHYFSENGGVQGLLGEALSLYAIAVALFMTISGFLAFDKIENITDTVERWKNIKLQVIRILKVYLAWSVPYMIYNLFMWDWENLTANYVLWKLQKYVFGSTFHTIWFMPSLAIGLIICFWMTEKLPKWIVGLVAVALYCVGSLTLTYRFVGEQMPYYELFRALSSQWLNGSRGWLYFGFPLTLLGKQMVYYKGKIKCSVMIVLSVLSMFLLIAEALIIRKLSGTHTGIDMTIMMLPTVFCILGFLITVKLPDSTVYVWFRKMSVIIFMSQRLFLTVLPNCVPVLRNVMSNYQGVCALIFCGGTVCFSAIIIWASNKTKWLRVLY